MPQNLTYVLPRAVIVLIGWGVTYLILTALSTHVPPAVVYMAGVAWVLAGVVCFGYHLPAAPVKSARCRTSKRPSRRSPPHRRRRRASASMRRCRQTAEIAA